MADKITTETVGKFLREHCPELKPEVLNFEDKDVNVRMSWELDFHVPSDSPFAFLGPCFLGELYNHIGKMQVIADHIREECNRM